MKKAAIDVSAKNQNVVMSPLSVYIAAAMCLAGARRNTAQQIENVLRLNQINNQTAFNAIGNLTRDMKVRATKFKYDIISSLSKHVENLGRGGCQYARS